MIAIAGIYSGQLFNLLIGLGISYVVKGIRKGYFYEDTERLISIFSQRILC